MTAPLTGMPNKIGTCPHGLPQGACPICSGMGGGGATRAHEKPKAGEMSWEQCYAIGQMMKAKKAAKENAAQMSAQQIEAAILARQIAQVKAIIAGFLPQNITKIFDSLKTFFQTPFLQTVQKFSQSVQNLLNSANKFIDTLKEKLANITDKLAAIFGEAKNALEKKISEKFKDLKKKFFDLFSLGLVDNEEDEEVKKIEEKKRREEMKKLNSAVFEMNKAPEMKEMQ